MPLHPKNCFSIECDVDGRRLESEDGAEFRLDGFEEAVITARDGADTAWRAVRTSPAAQLLQHQVAGQPPRGVEETAHRLAVLRQALPDLARRIDRTDLEDVARLHGNGTRSAQEAAGHRTNAAAVRTEQQLRASIAARHPELHDTESQARRAHIAKQRAREQQARENAARQGRRYQPPAPKRGGPSMGR
jgi:hypothetical protein